MTWVKLAIYLAVFAAGAAGGIKFNVGITAQRDLASHEAQAKASARRADRIDTAAVALESDKNKIRIEFLTITKEVDRVVQKTVYSNVCFDDDGLRVINAAIHPATAASQLTPALPEPAAPD